MAYTPPSADAVALQFSAVAYTPPAGDAVAFSQFATYVGGVSGPVQFAAVADGFTPVLFIGPVIGPLAFTSSAQGGYGPGAQLYAFLRFTATGAGTEPFIGLVDTTFPITGVAVGRGHVQGDAAATVGISATGLMFGAIVGNAYYDEGVFSAESRGFTSLIGGVSGAMTFSAAASGLATAGGGATGSIRFSATGAGQCGATGTVAAQFPFVPATTASHGLVGAASAPIRFLGAASGVLGGTGTVSATTPFTATATGSATVYPVGDMYAVLGIAAYAYGLGQPEEVDACA